MSNLLSFFRCGHKRTTFPITLKSGHPVTTSTYVVCLDCGKEFPYDWREMKLKRSPVQSSQPWESTPKVA
jgi:hypothetical protein